MLDEADSPHVAGQVVHLIDVLNRALTVFLFAQVESQRFCAVGHLIPEVLRLDVNRTDLVSPGQQLVHQMATDEAPATGDENTISAR